jgi:hypothetical protein
MQMQKQTMQNLCMQNALDLLGTMQRKSTAQSTNTKTRKLVKVQAASKSDDKLKKKSVKPKKKA